MHKYNPGNIRKVDKRGRDNIQTIILFFHQKFKGFSKDCIFDGPGSIVGRSNIGSCSQKLGK